MKKKILYVTEAFAGGIFTYLVDLSNELVESFDICIAYSKRPQTPNNFKDYFDSRIQFVKIEHFTREINPLQDLQAMGEIKHIVKTFKPDIVHLNSSKAGVLGRLGINERKIKVFYTPHGYSFLMQNTSKLKRSAYWLIEKAASLNKSVSISCSKGEYEVSKSINRRARWVNNGVNMEKLDRIPLAHVKMLNDSEKVRLCTIGRISSQKNPNLFNEIAEAFPSYEFLWIGDGEQKDELTSSNIKVTGWVSRGKALEFANRSDIFILTSLWEGLPMSLLEAMYLQKPCVVSNVVGNRDVIQDSKNGFVCPDLNSFVSRIKLLCNNPVISKKIVDRAKTDIRVEYNTKNMAHKYRKIYEESIVS
ncbi:MULTISPECIES: glycosyltransferase [Lentilactobacillus]|uniref:Alpha(1,3)galactosyltransferase EpsF n=1 Tax=Lentilactobacillus otakiensis DSM 19908 = JCM 15040 TaxID=1423780 RepID=S4PR15_9LACO|nr:MULTISPECIES: glycosyltransferase [Lentilactobacillus]KRL12619.1 alpha(1,3)galactosyltransferase EpsF [Lentilactobacillus otakiensis DSM 19908 = JCM 15040]MCT3252075.1 glycosyltransferase [Lentilactobacillus buchneri]MCT3546664.1 glycosyltransferase [Lentilactobacillus buchneri]MCT4437257.1 glycosyltransferase [Lentilactobacillus buchneri]GAD17705.1 alpha(1,3)galactosyltransferase EpsF [Lentilactobacillus otakiensis DSM 19908 = JCM 15040]